MRLRLYADECLDARIVGGTRQRGLYWVTAAEAGLLGAIDPAHADRARALGCILVTSDTDFLAVIPPEGVIFVKQSTPVGVAIARLTEIARTFTRADLAGRIEWV